MNSLGEDALVHGVFDDGILKEVKSITVSKGEEQQWKLADDKLEFILDGGKVTLTGVKDMNVSKLGTKVGGCFGGGGNTGQVDER